jgi:hypothetical protein
MDQKLLDAQTPSEFFRAQVGKALEHRRLENSAFAAGYLVDLLTRCLRADALPAPEPGFDDVPLALLYLRALQAPAHERARRLRQMGDTALFVSGFFADGLADRDGDLRYYRRLGGFAYARLGRERSWLGTDVFTELAARFPAYADVLSEVSESSGLTATPSLLRLYERWSQTRSARAARLLQEHGITPVEPQDGRVH